MPLPLVWDPAKRLQGLKESLDPKSSHYYFIERMHPNIKAVIAAYEAGTMTEGGTFYFKRRENGDKVGSGKLQKTPLDRGPFFQSLTNSTFRSLIVANHSGWDTSRIRERTEKSMVRFRGPCHPIIR